MAETTNSTRPLSSCLRLDLQPAFCDLSDDLSQLVRLTNIAETVRDDLLRRAELNLLKLAVDQPDLYFPVLMTRDQREDLIFITGLMTDVAERAMKRYDAAVEGSMGRGQ